MTTIERAPLDLETRRRPGTSVGWIVEHAPVVLAAVVVLMRLPYASAAPSPDEAGFLAVARQWQPGTSLYGNYWVDRPPLLVTIFRIAAELGGLAPLRVIGALAAASIVLGTARVAHQVAGRRASTCAAVIAAALCVSPLMGSAAVNGELLAAPFVAWGLAAFVAALRPTGSLHGRARLVVASGAALAAAVLVKQNFVDVGVCALAALLIALVRHEVGPGRAARLAIGFLGGMVACVAVTGVWTVLHGTSVAEVYDAMYPFRLAAARAMAASGNPAPAGRFVILVELLLLTTVPALALVSAVAIARRRIRDTVVWALVVMTGFDLVSICASGNYWSHYLVQLIVPVAVLGGILAGSRQAGARLAVGAVVLSGLIGWSVAMPPASSEASLVGHAVGAASDPGDTIVTIYGHADVTESSGLTSPYPYLWSLPLDVRDPHVDLLEHTLTGPGAPTWLVTWSEVTSTGADTAGLPQVVDGNYRRVADLDGHAVYLRDGVSRATPILTH